MIISLGWQSQMATLKPTMNTVLVFKFGLSKMHQKNDYLFVSVKLEYIHEVQPI